jgi:hypothetical protein
MPFFDIKDEQTGRTIRVEGDSAPTEAEAAELFSSSAPEMVAGNEPQMAGQRARNLQSELGLEEPVDPQGRAPNAYRFFMGAAPTADERRALLDSQFGVDGHIALGDKRALVRVSDNKGGRKWVVDDPVGLDAGDFAQVLPKAPEIAVGALTAMANIPGPQGMAAKALVASGAAALTSNIVGAITDATFRLNQGTPVDVPEIVKRRGLSGAVETAAGVVLPLGLSKIAQGGLNRKAIVSSVKAFMEEGNDAKRALLKAGVNAPTVGHVPDAIRAMHPTNMTSQQAGEQIASVLNKTDEAIRNGSARMVGKAGADVAARGEAMMAGATAAPITSEMAGKATIGGVKQHFQKAQEAVDMLYETANKEIAAAGKASGEGSFIIALPETEKAVKDMLANRLRADTGEPIKLGTALVSQLQEISKATGATQKLAAVRNLRSQLASHFRGGGIFEGMDEGAAKKLYGTLSQDIDNSVSALTGPGAQALRDANAAYKALVAPVEANTLLAKTADGAWQNGDDLVEAFTKGGANDWAAIKTVMPAQTYAQFRRAVADKLMGGNPVVIGGREYSDFVGLGRRLRDIGPEVKNEIFGSQKVWDGLQRLGREQEFIAAKQGIFSRPQMPTKDQLVEVADVMRAEGFDKANGFLSKAMKAQEARTNSLYGALVSQAKAGNFTQVAKNPDAMFDALLSGKYGPDYVKGIVKKMPPEVREQVSRAAMQHSFENAKTVAQSTISGRLGTYDTDKMAMTILGSPEKRQAARALLGDERFNLIENWAKLSLKTQVEMAQKGKFAHKVGRLLSVLPYGKLLMARAGQEAIETAAGKRLISGINPETAVLFAEARQTALARDRTVLGNVLLQKAASSPLYKDYSDMMGQFTPEQQNAVDAFLLGGEPNQ